MLRDLAAVGHRRGEPHQGLQDAQFDHGQRGTAVADPDLARRRVALQVADRQPGWQQVGRPALQRAQPGEQLSEVEWLAHVVVRAGVEASHPVGRRVLAADHQDRHPGTPAAQLAHHVDAGHPGYQPVEHRDGVVVAAGVAQRHFAVADEIYDVTTVTQPLDKHLTENVVVFRYKDSHNTKFTRTETR